VLDDLLLSKLAAVEQRLQSVRGRQGRSELLDSLLDVLGDHRRVGAEVNSDDAAAWKKGLAKVKGAEVEVMPKANHLFIDGEGVSMPAEYGKPGHVGVAVVERIAAFTAR
jgi:hypothetical protein